MRPPREWVILSQSTNFGRSDSRDLSVGLRLRNAHVVECPQTVDSNDVTKSLSRVNSLAPFHAPLSRL